MPQNPEPPYYSDICQQYGLTQALFFPTDPELIFRLNPEDIVSEDIEAGKNISIKYQSFTREISAVVTEFSITLPSVIREDLNVIVDFANADFLNNVRTTGRGSLALYYRGQELTGLYIQPPIKSSKSAFVDRAGFLGPSETTPEQVEVFETVELKIISPDPRWF